jgi:hypothetical protein
MNIRDMSKPVTAKSLNESLARRFGQRINLEAFTLEKLQDTRNNLRTKMSQVETNESFNSVQSGTYQKTKLFLDVLNAEIAERELVQAAAVNERRLREGAEDQAQLVMAAKDMVDRVTGWMEDTAEMETESMLELADSLRDELGSEQSEAFTSLVRPALEALYQVMSTTRDTLIQGVNMVTGEGEVADPMGDDDLDSDLGDDDLDLDIDIDGGDIEDSDSLDMGDDFGADAASAGGDLEAGRAKRESVQRSSKKKVTESSEQALYLTTFMSNFYSGKYYQQGMDSMFVLASSPEEAKAIAGKNLGAALEHFKNKRYLVGSRKTPAIRKEEKVIKLGSGTAKATSQQKHGKVLQADGTVGPVDLSNMSEAVKKK